MVTNRLAQPFHNKKDMVKIHLIVRTMVSVIYVGIISLITLSISLVS